MAALDPATAVGNDASPEKAKAPFQPNSTVVVVTVVEVVVTVVVVTVEVVTVVVVTVVVVVVTVVTVVVVCLLVVVVTVVVVKNPLSTMQGARFPGAHMSNTMS